MINDTIKSVKGIIILNKRYLLQLRDNKKIFIFQTFGVSLEDVLT